MRLIFPTHALLDFFHWHPAQEPKEIIPFWWHNASEAKLIEMEYKNLKPFGLEGNHHLFKNIFAKIGPRKNESTNQGLQLLSRARASFDEIGFNARIGSKLFRSLAFLSTEIFKYKKSLGLPLISPSVVRWTSYATHACARALTFPLPWNKTQTWLGIVLQKLK